MSYAIQDSIKLSATPEHVFAVATDWENQHRWVFATRARADKNNGQGVGGSIWAFTGLLGIGFIDTMTITAWQPPFVCNIVHTGKVVRGSGSFKVAAGMSGSTFTWSEELELPFGILNSLAWIFVKPISRWALHLTLKRFQKIVQK